MGSRLSDFWISRDSRDKDGFGWRWDEEEKKPGKSRILGTKDVCLKSGDYSISLDGENVLSDLVVIERKQGFCELFTNLINKENRIRFEAELERLRPVKYKYLLVESNISMDNMSLSVPQIFHGPPSSKIVSSLLEYQIEFGIIPMFVGDAGKKVASQIFKTIARKEL